MLGKLLKYEWKSTRRIFPLLYAAILIIALLFGLSMRRIGVGGNEIGSLLFMAIYIILVMALMVVTVVVIIARFYKNMISQEGYLTHVLPVRMWQHTTSKTIMAFVWFLLAVAVVLVSVFVMAAATGELDVIWQEIKINEILEAIGGIGPQITLCIICILVQIIRLILQFYTSMAIGGTANKHKILYSFLAFIVIAIIVNIVNTLLSLGTVSGITDIVIYGTANVSISGIFVKQLISDAAISVVFFILTNYFLKNRLNLE